MARLISGLLFFNTIAAQDPAVALKTAFAKLESDTQMKYGLAALYVVDLSTGKTVFDRNARIGMAPASSQKVITAATALELLGPAFAYTTNFGYTGPVQDGILRGDLLVEGSGDPSLGSFRFRDTKADVLREKMQKALHSADIKSISGGIKGSAPGYESVQIPGGWIWEDIGNYYGAGHGGLNWNENQYDLWLRPGKQSGEPVAVIRTIPAMIGQPFINELTTGKAGSGDQAYIYFIPGKQGLYIRGSIPCCVDSFRISGAVTDPAAFALQQVKNISGADGAVEKFVFGKSFDKAGWKLLFTHTSPKLDTLVYWFLQKSVNLYGEALVHTLAQKIKGKANYDSGISLIQDFWSSKGIDRRALHIMDGSGLSPQNRVTAEALVQVMMYARKRPWYPVFYEALPVYNGIKSEERHKIGGATTYTGYIKSKRGGNMPLRSW